MERQIEFEEMKAQLALLKRKLEKETIVNERLIRRAMSNKVSGLNRRITICIVIGLVCIPYCTHVFHDKVHTSWIFTAITILYLLACIGTDLYMMRMLRSRDVLTNNLTDVSRQIIRTKKLYLKWLSHVGIPFLCVWLPWLFYEITQTSQNGEFMIGMLVGCATGAVIGGMVGYVVYRRNMRTYDELLKEIEEMTETKTEDA